MSTRGIIVLLVLLVQEGGRRESGRYTLSVSGRETGVEEYRLEEFEDGKTVLFARAKFELDLAGTKRGYLTDTVLTMDKSYAPALYAGFRKAGRDQDQVKIEWDKGFATTPKKQIRTNARFLLDPTVVSHLIPILRGADLSRNQIRLFNPTSLSDFDGSIEDRGEALLRGKESALRVREIQVRLGYVTYTAHVDDKKRLIRAWSAVNNCLAELEGFEGYIPEGLAPEGIEETDVMFSSGTIKLAATATRPRGAKSSPAVLLIPDTGPHDRQGNLVTGRGGAEEFAWPGGGASLQRSIAQSLAAAGLLVLRYDDRGCGQSEGDFGKARFSDLVADADAAVSYLRSRPDAGPVAVVGHGEGALAACMLAAKDGSIRSVVLLAPPPAPLDEILLLRAERTLREQGTRDDTIREMLAQQRKLFEAIRSAKEDVLEIDERRTFVGWMRERFAIDPRVALAKVQAQALLCVGTRDRELSAAQVETLRLTRPGLESKIFEGLDHAFAGPEGRVDPNFLKFLAERLPQTLK